MTSPSPGQIGRFLANRYYPSDEAYLYTLADVMKREYQAIARAGFTLQVDCPDLALGRHTQFAHLTLAEFRRVAEMHVEVLNHAVAGIPPGADAHAHLLGQHRRPAPPRRAAGRHRRHRAQGPARRPHGPRRQSASRPRVAACGAT